VCAVKWCECYSDCCALSIAATLQRNLGDHVDQYILRSLNEFSTHKALSLARCYATKNRMVSLVFYRNGPVAHLFISESLHFMGLKIITTRSFFWEVQITIHGCTRRKRAHTKYHFPHRNVKVTTLGTSVVVKWMQISFV
jgi:hypothetical protein